MSGWAVTNYRDVQRDLRALSPEMRKELNKKLKAAAAIVAADAGVNASWSTRIPSAIVPTAGMKYAGVRINRRKAPHGSLFELGSRRNRGSIRHPLFGNRDYWYSIPTRPFIAPALRADTPKVRALIIEAMRDASRKAGFRWRI